MFELRDYQINISNRSIDILRQYRMVCYAIEVRCGKTLMALETARKYGAKNVLFVTTLKTFGSITQDWQALSPGFELFLCNYESLHKCLGVYDFVIVDECHKCGAFPKPSNCVIELRRIIGNLPCVLMSGTFTPESWSQIFHILSVSKNSPFAQYRNFYSWAKDFVTIKKKYYFNREINDYSTADWNKIKAVTSHLFISHTQAEAGFTQMVEEEVLRIQMKATTYGLANILIKKKIHQGKNGEVILGDTAVKLRSKLHQIFSGTVIRDDGEHQGVVFDNSKIDFIASHFAGQKIAVYYVYKAESAMLRWHLAKFGYKVTESPEEFNATDHKTVFISQIRAGREGINLSSADAIVMLNIEYSYVSYAQVRARLQIKERTKPAKVFWVMAAGGIEEKILERVRSKSDYTLVHFEKDFAIVKEAKVA